MPEGPEVRTVASKLNQYLSGKILQSIVISDRSKFISGISGSEYWKPSYIVTQVTCKGKNIIFVLQNHNQTLYLFSHLMMTGRWHWDLKDRYLSVSLMFDGFVACFSDKDKKATMKFVPIQNITSTLDNIGIDFLQLAINLFSLSSDKFNEQYYQELKLWYSKMSVGKRRNWQICKILMEQEIYSGIGNYLKAEILYKSRMRPDRLVSEINPDEWNPLFYNILTTIYMSFQCGGLTFSTYSDPDGKVGTFSKVIYENKICPLGYPIITTKFKDNRTTHWVPDVQK